MLGSTFIFAQTDGIEELLGQPAKGGGGLDLGESVIILSLIFLLALALFCWAYFIRKRSVDRVGGRVLARPSRRRHGEADSDRHSRYGQSGRRRRRRRMEDHRKRNPTLGETGGLPPLRPEDPEDRTGNDSSASTQPQT